MLVMIVTGIAQEADHDVGVGSRKTGTIGLVVSNKISLFRKISLGISFFVCFVPSPEYVVTTLDLHAKEA